MSIAAPAFGMRSIQWVLSRNDRLNSSGWTGRGMVVADPWSAKWKAHVELAAIQGEANARTIKSFLARCKGSTQAFRLPATAVAQNANAGVTVTSDAAAGATSLVLSGATTAMLDGQLVTVNGQLLCCTAAQSGSTITFFPPLRKAATAGTQVVTSRPYALVFMSSSKQGWSIGLDRLFGVAFDVEEAMLEDDAGGVPESFSLLREDGFHILREDGGFVLRE